MAGRTWFNDQRYTSQGLVECDLSFVTNGTLDPDPTLFRGCGGLTGSQIGAGLPNNGPSVVTSITFVSTGRYRLTFADGYRFIQAWTCDMQDDGTALVAKLGAFQNEGAGRSTPLIVDVFVRSGTTLTNSTGVRIAPRLVLKDSGNGG